MQVPFVHMVPLHRRDACRPTLQAPAPQVPQASFRLVVPRSAAGCWRAFGRARAMRAPAPVGPMRWHRQGPRLSLRQNGCVLRRQDVLYIAPRPRGPSTFVLRHQARQCASSKGGPLIRGATHRRQDLGAANVWSKFFWTPSSFRSWSKNSWTILIQEIIGNYIYIYGFLDAAKVWSKNSWTVLDRDGSKKSWTTAERRRGRWREEAEKRRNQRRGRGPRRGGGGGGRRRVRSPSRGGGRGANEPGVLVLVGRMPGLLFGRREVAHRWGT